VRWGNRGKEKGRGWKRKGRRGRGLDIGK